MKLLIIIISTFFSVAVSAQSFFAPIKRIKPVAGKGITVTASQEPTFWAFRPAAIGATLYIGGTVEAAGGAGIAYQNITQKLPDGRNYVNYDIGIYVLAGGPVTQEAPSTDVEKFAIIASALNGTVGAGYAMSRQDGKWKGGLALVWKINFNN